MFRLAIRRGAGGNVGKQVSSGYNRRRRLATRSSGKQQAGRTAVRAAPIVCPEESPLLVSISDNFAVKNSPLAGLDAPTPAREKGLQPYGALYCFGWRSEGDWGERREARAQWAQPPKAVSAPEFRQTTSGPHGSANRADCLPRGKPPACIDRRQLCRKKFPLAGPDAPSPARGQGLQPYGALTLFFRWRKKSVQKKASGTATPEAARPAARRGLRPAVAPSGLSSSSVRFAHPPGKRLLLPIWAAGLAMSRAAELASLRMLSCALGARLFPPSKWAGLFPSAAYRRSAPPQLAVGRLTPCGVGWFPVGWPILEGHRPAGLGARAARPVAERR